MQSKAADLHGAYPFGIGAAPDLDDPVLGVSTWFTDPPGMLNRFAPGREVGDAQALHVTLRVDATMRKRYPADSKFYYVHDFSDSSNYTSRARSLLTQWGIARQREGRVAGVYIVPPPMHALFRMGVHTATMVLRAAGMNVHVARTVQEVVRVLRLRHLAPAAP